MPIFLFQKWKWLLLLLWWWWWLCVLAYFCAVDFKTSDGIRPVPTYCDTLHPVPGVLVYGNPGRFKPVLRARADGARALVVATLRVVSHHICGALSHLSPDRVERRPRPHRTVQYSTVVWMC